MEQAPHQTHSAHHEWRSTIDQLMTMRRRQAGAGRRQAEQWALITHVVDSWITMTMIFIIYYLLLRLLHYDYIAHYYISRMLMTFSYISCILIQAGRSRKMKLILLIINWHLTVKFSFIIYDIITLFILYLAYLFSLLQIIITFIIHYSLIIYSLIIYYSSDNSWWLITFTFITTHSHDYYLYNSCASWRTSTNARDPTHCRCAARILPGRRRQI